MNQREFIEIAGFVSRPAADTAVARLRAAGIEVRLAAGPMGGLGTPTGAALLVPSDSADAAHQLLSSGDSDVTDERLREAVEDEKRWRQIPLETIDAGLARIRRRRRFMWVWFLTYLPMAAFLAIVGASSFAVPVAVFWMAAFMVTGIIASNSKCPRWGSLFCRRRGLVWNPYTQHCLSCGLPLRTRRGGQSA